MKCAKCGCDDNNPCFTEVGTGKLWRVTDLEQLDDRELVAMNLIPCCWVQDGLCSACVESPAPAPLLFGPDGQPLRGSP